MRVCLRREHRRRPWRCLPDQPAEVLLREVEVVPSQLRVRGVQPLNLKTVPDLNRETSSEEGPTLAPAFAARYTSGSLSSREVSTAARNTASSAGLNEPLPQVMSFATAITERP
ncbi:hypothetical protein Vafri_15239 [Volvox africanus]|uniref:Uncharacterized protein n=1 Tax=Volvox africanus TaxID=51714 RepID=A0A8J4F5J0_9CHLO|nr:hypothetical protein Vafri_15239 [Volvox africanus]